MQEFTYVEVSNESLGDCGLALGAMGSVDVTCKA